MEDLNLQIGDCQKNVVELREEISKNVEEIIKTKMPYKIMHLSSLLAAGFSPSLPSQQENETFCKKRRLESTDTPGTVVPSNELIKSLQDTLKKEIVESINLLNTVKIWIQLNIPRIDSGNNFGVSIQEDTISELTRSEDACFNLLESVTKYFITRGKLVSKVIKYPQIQDYQQSIVELDEKEYFNLKLSCLDMRNNLAIVHDLILKNLDKIIKPRTTHHMDMF